MRFSASASLTGPGLYARAAWTPDLADGRRRRAALGGALGERTTVGRDPEADIHIDDEAVSWNHLEIESRGGVLMATDLDSRNGTALNGEPLDRPRRLRDGDVLIVGGHRLEVSDPVPGRAGRDRRRERARGRAHRGGAGDRGGAGRSLPQRGRLRRPSRDPGRDRRGAPRQRAHRPAPPRRARRQARRPRRRRPRAPPPDRRPRDRARPRPPLASCELRLPAYRAGKSAALDGSDRAKRGPVGVAAVVGALASLGAASVAQVQVHRSKGNAMRNRSLLISIVALVALAVAASAGPGRLAARRRLFQIDDRRR